MERSKLLRIMLCLACLRAVTGALPAPPKGPPVRVANLRNDAHLDHALRGIRQPHVIFATDSSDAAHELHGQFKHALEELIAKGLVKVELQQRMLKRGKDYIVTWKLRSSGEFKGVVCTYKKYIFDHEGAKTIPGWTANPNEHALVDPGLKQQYIKQHAQDYLNDGWPRAFELGLFASFTC